MKFVTRLAMLGSMVLAADACDDKCTDCDPPEFGYEFIGCSPRGTTPYRVRSGTYKTPAAQDLSEDCGFGLIPELFAGERQVKNDPTVGEISVSTADGSVLLGRGPVRCNKGTLTYRATLQTATCSYESDRSSLLEVTADDTLTLKYTETLTQFRAVSGMTCSAPPRGSCAIAYTLHLKQ